MGPGVGMGLESKDNPLVTHGLNRLNRSSQLAGVVRIIIKQVSTIYLALELQTATCSVKTG